MPKPNQNKHDPTKVRLQKCSTCPFRHGSPFAHLQDNLTAQVLTEGNHMCHAEQLQNKKPTYVCRGARDIQLQVFCKMGVVEAPTDEAWAEALERIQPKTET